MLLMGMMVVWLISVRLMAAKQSLLHLSDFSDVISPWIVIFLSSLKNVRPSLPDRLLQFTTAEVVGSVHEDISHSTANAFSRYIVCLPIWPPELHSGYCIKRGTLYLGNFLEEIWKLVVRIVFSMVVHLIGNKIRVFYVIFTSKYDISFLVTFTDISSLISSHYITTFTCLMSSRDRYTNPSEAGSLYRNWARPLDMNQWRNIYLLGPIMLCSVIERNSLD